MKYFHVKFVGRTVGAIGAFSRCEAFVAGADINAALGALYEDYEHIQQAVWTELPVRYAPTFVEPGTGLRTLAASAQGRYTYDTPAEATAWLDAIQTNSASTLRQVYGPAPRFEVRPVVCWPNHHDPIGIYFPDAPGAANWWKVGRGTHV